MWTQGLTGSQAKQPFASWTSVKPAANTANLVIISSGKPTANEGNAFL